MIKGLRPRLAEAGKIKIGKKGKEITSARGKKYCPPVKLDHFLVTTTQKGPDENFILDERVMSALLKKRKDGGYADDKDGKVREIPILLLSDEIDDVFPTSYAKWSGQNKYCEGDGEKATRYEIKKNEQGFYERTGEQKDVDCPCAFLMGEKPSCLACGTLHCSINVPGIATFGSVYLYRTKSVISIKEMLGSLFDLKARCGVLMNLPLLLRVSPVKTKRGVVQCCHLAMTADNVLQVMREALEMRQAMQTLRAAEAPSYKAIAPAAEDELDYDPSDDDPEDDRQCIDTDATDPAPAPDPDPPAPQPEPEAPPSDDSPPSAAEPPPFTLTAQEEPLGRDSQAYIDLTEAFVRLCESRRLSGDDQEEQRATFWDKLCKEAIGMALKVRPTPSEATKLIEHMKTLIPPERAEGAA